MQIENVKIVMKPVNEIIPYWRNPRRNDKTVDALVEVISKSGFNVPLVIDKNNVVVKGHARLRAAKRLGMTEVPCIVSEASEDVIKADRIADNKIQELSRWDFGKLNMELDKLDGKMHFMKLFRPEDGISHEDVEMPQQIEYKPVGLDFQQDGDTDSDFDGYAPQQHEHDYVSHGAAHTEYASGGTDAPVTDYTPVVEGSPVMQQAPEKKNLKTLCPYCGKVVIINI